jgi:hypothetical protein
MTTNAPRSRDPQPNSSASAAERQAQARLDAGLGPPRETAPATYVRPPDAGSRSAQWLLVTCVGALGLAVVLLLLASFLGPDSTLAKLFGTRLSVQAVVTPPALDVESALPNYVSLLPGYQLWLTDDFAAPSQLAAAGAGQATSSVLVDRGVYRMQVTPGQLGWTLFDLAQTTSYHLETSATVDAAAPAGAAGVIARFDGPGSFYLLTVDGDGVASVQLWLDGVRYDAPASAALAAGAGQANRLAVADDGERLRFYVNQVLVAEVAEPQLPIGRPGLAALAPGEQASAVDFDWMAIYRAEE